MELNTNNIVLIGMPGCGKSSIGSLLSKVLGLDFCDLDTYIEEKVQLTIPELFQQGEEHFRSMETNALRDMQQKTATVISTGGGIVTRLENMELLCQAGVIVYIDRPIEMILASSDLKTRPLLADNHHRIYTLYQERKHLYEKCCHFSIVNDQSLEKATNEIVNILTNAKKDTVI